MKAKYLYAALAAILCFAGACTQALPEDLAELKVSNSFVALPTDGGMVDITVTATEAWSISNIPDWLTVAPVSGSAGDTRVAFSADKATKANVAEVTINVGSKQQFIRVSQPFFAAEVKMSTCKQVLDGEDGKTYRVEGICTSIANTRYGNWYINDGTGTVYVYGTHDKNGAKMNDESGAKWKELNIEVGDKVVIEGPRTTYGTTVELVDVDVIKVTKSLVSVDPSSVNLEAEAGTFDITVSSKVMGVAPIVTVDWIRLKDVASAGSNVVYTFEYTENTTTQGRNAQITFKGPDVIKQVDVKQKGVVKEEPKTIAAVVAQIPESATGSSTAVEYEANLTGAVVSYVNGGNAYLEDASGAILLYLSGHGLEPGDVISGKISGKGYLYNGLPEIISIGSEFTKTAGGTIPATEMTVTQLEANYEANYSRRIILKNVTVTGAIADGDRNGEVTDGTTKLNVYAGLNNKGLVLEEGANGDLICFPTTFKGAHQVSFWDNAHFTKK